MSGIKFNDLSHVFSHFRNICGDVTVASIAFASFVHEGELLTCPPDQVGLKISSIPKSSIKAHVDKAREIQFRAIIGNTEYKDMKYKYDNINGRVEKILKIHEPLSESLSNLAAPEGKVALARIIKKYSRNTTTVKLLFWLESIILNIAGACVGLLIVYLLASFLAKLGLFHLDVRVISP